MLPFVLLLLFFSFHQPAATQPLTSTADLAALFSLRASLGLRSREWPRKTDPCKSWTGVGCRAGRVVSLSLSGLRRTRLGRRRPTFAVDGLQNLTRLESFNSTGFALPGPIPDWFGRRLPASLAVLDLRSAKISGEIPSSLGGAVGLRVLGLAENFINGSIPSTLGQLSNLTVLDLSFNSISGPIPSSLGSLSSLQTVILSNNSLNESIPPQLGDLKYLLVLDLSFNSLLGSLPDEFKNLRRLQQLKLSHNFLSGSLPDSIWLLRLEFLDVSYNNLTGNLPDLMPANSSPNAGGSVFNLSNNLYYGSISSKFGAFFGRFSIVDLSDNYFEGTVPLDGKNGNTSFGSNCFKNASNQRTLVDCQEFYREKGIAYDDPLAPKFPNGKKSKHWKYILGGVLGSLGLAIAVILLIIFCRRRPRARTLNQGENRTNATPPVKRPPQYSGDYPGFSISFPVSGDVFTYEQLVQMTSGFTSLIKNGRSGDLYHGVLDSGFSVVVKRIDVGRVRHERYSAEMELFAKASHIRLVPCLGHCSEKENEKFLVYKYMLHGDLSNAFYRKASEGEEGLKSLDWITRLKIAIGVTEALCFLHHECNPPLVHRDVQASSILLDDKYEVRLGSLSEVCAQEGDGHQNVFMRFLRLSQKSDRGASGSPAPTCAYDVYCLGKVLLELVTGNLGTSTAPPTDDPSFLDQTLPFISLHDKESMSKVTDPTLILDEDLTDEVWAVAVVAKYCLHPKPSKRPLARYVLKALENPLKVVRADSRSNSTVLRATNSSRTGSWRGAFFGSWRRSSSDLGSGPLRSDRSFRRSGPLTSNGSLGDRSFSHKRASREIFPEPSGEAEDGDA